MIAVLYAGDIQCCYDGCCAGYGTAKTPAAFDAHSGQNGTDSRRRINVVLPSIHDEACCIGLRPITELISRRPMLRQQSCLVTSAAPSWGAICSSRKGICLHNPIGLPQHHLLGCCPLSEQNRFLLVNAPHPHLARCQYAPAARKQRIYCSDRHQNCGSMPMCCRNWSYKTNMPRQAWPPERWCSVIWSAFAWKLCCRLSSLGYNALLCRACSTPILKRT